MRRMAWLYRHSRAYLHLLTQVGSLGQELLTAATELGLGGWTSPAVHESRLRGDARAARGRRPRRAVDRQARARRSGEPARSTCRAATRCCGGHLHLPRGRGAVPGRRLEPRQRAHTRVRRRRWGRFYTAAGYALLVPHRRGHGELGRAATRSSDLAADGDAGDGGRARGGAARALSGATPAAAVRWLGRPPPQSTPTAGDVRRVRTAGCRRCLAAEARSGRQGLRAPSRPAATAWDEQPLLRKRLIRARRRRGGRCSWSRPANDHSLGPASVLGAARRACACFRAYGSGRARATESSAAAARTSGARRCAAFLGEALRVLSRPWSGRRLHFVGIGGRRDERAGAGRPGRGRHGDRIGPAPETRYLPRLRGQRDRGEGRTGRRSNVPAGARSCYSSAVPAREPRAPARPSCARGELLGQLARLRRCIAVAGSHGKTTTAAMIVHALECCRRAARLRDRERPAVPRGSTPTGATGSGWWWRPTSPTAASSRCRPDIAVMTEVGLEHVQTYPTRRDVDEAFAAFRSGAKRAVD